MSGSLTHNILKSVADGSLSVQEAQKLLPSINTNSLDRQDRNDLNLDLDRFNRVGLPEVVLCSNKTKDQILSALRGLASADMPSFGTRCSVMVGEALAEAEPAINYDSVSRTIRYGASLRADQSPRIAILSAGTSDMPVAAEAERTLTTFGLQVERFPDMGVAGLHRLISAMPQIGQADVLIVVAGMEGALPSVVAGLLSIPIIAVPTSVGYGVANNGQTALFGMLASCAPGLAVVNIDNGFGAASIALRIARKIVESRKSNYSGEE